MKSDDHGKRGFRAFLGTWSLGSVIAWGALLIGALLPWCMGIVVKIRLDSKGLPTWNWTYFLNPFHLLLEIWATFWFALPAILLAFLTYGLFSPKPDAAEKFNRFEKAVIVLSGLAFGVISSVPLFNMVFESFDPDVLIFPFAATLYCGFGYALGLGCGLLAALLSTVIRTKGDET